MWIAVPWLMSCKLVLPGGDAAHAAYTFVGAVGGMPSDRVCTCVGASTDAAGNLYLLDARGFIAVHDPRGAFLQRIAIPVGLSLGDFLVGEGGAIVAAGDRGVWEWIPSSGVVRRICELSDMDPRLCDLAGYRVAIGPQRVFAADSITRSVRVFSPRGDLLYVLGTGGEGPLASVAALTACEDAGLLVCDQSRGVVLYYRRKAFRRAYGYGALRSPRGAFFSRGGRLVVLDGSELVVLEDSGEVVQRHALHGASSRGAIVKLLRDSAAAERASVVLANGAVVQCDLSSWKTDVVVESPLEAVEHPLRQPLDIAADSKGQAYVTDYLNGLLRVARDGTVQRMSLSGELPAGFAPQEVALTPEGRLVLLGQSNLGIFSEDGALVRWILREPRGVFAIQAPSGLCCDPLGNVYVADAMGQRVQKISSTGVFVVAFAFPPPEEVRMGVTTYVLRENPNGVTLDSNGRVIAGSSQGNLRIFSPDGALIGLFPMAPQSHRSFVADVAIDPRRNIVASNPKTCALLTLSQEGKVLATDHLRDLVPMPGFSPGCLAFGAEGILYVLDSASASVAKLKFVAQ